MTDKTDNKTPNKVFKPLTKLDCEYGAPMGRSNIYPTDRDKPIKLHLRKVGLDNGGYDCGNAYWGHAPTTLYRAVNPETQPCSDFSRYSELTTWPEIFLHAKNREEAIAKIRKTLPAASFYC